MSKMRMSVIAIFALISFGLSGNSTVLATPVNGGAIDAIAPRHTIEKVYYYGHRHYRYRHYRHCWWHYGRRICRW
jgi:hypothetical protein